jgi:HD-GYP domain-containing protein (c-di-GMP phosphodiesterase class II)
MQPSAMASLLSRNPIVSLNDVEIRFSEVIGALSYALDLTEGQPQGHAARSCFFGMRLAKEMKLPLDQSSALFYGLLMKDLGCSTNASKMCYLFGADDRKVKGGIKTVNWSSTPSAVLYAAGAVAPQGSFLQKIGQLTKVALAGPKKARELIELRCERGAKIARELHFPDATAEAIRSLDEHWDGHGHPEGLKADAIPLLARILGLSQTVEVFARTEGIDAAYEMAQQRSGTWFDPDLVRTMLSFRNDQRFWEMFFVEDPSRAVSVVEPQDQAVFADPATLDRIAHGFAQVIDAKSPWTFQHSEGVCEIAGGIAATMGFSPAEIRIIRRAGLLHDMGKLGISNLILDKPGKLTAEELTEMRKHPAYTYQLLHRVTGFRELASLAASHHERLDGKGYHRGLAADDLSTADRILCVADMFEALAAKRPYRKDLSSEEVMTILTRAAGDGICPEVFDALKFYLARGGYTPTAIAA